MASVKEPLMFSFAPLKKLQSGIWTLQDDVVTPTAGFSFLEKGMLFEYRIHCCYGEHDWKVFFR
jgi:hypothetical protein